MINNYEKICKTIGENITILREQRGISQLELAKALGVTAASICSYEKGKAMSLQNFLNICTYFDVSLQAMISSMTWRTGNQNINKYIGEYYLYYFDNNFKSDKTNIKNGTLELISSNKSNLLSAKIITESSVYTGTFRLFEEQFAINLFDKYKALTIYGLAANLRSHNYIGGLTLTLSVCHGHEHRPIFYKQLVSKYPIQDEDSIIKHLLLDYSEDKKSVRLKRSQDNEVYHLIKEQINNEE